MSRLLSLLLLAVGLYIFAFVVLVAFIVNEGQVHHLEDATSFPPIV